MTSDPELISFCQAAVEEFGGVAEAGDGWLTAFLSPGLAETLEMPEEVELGSEDNPLLYGSPFLDRLIDLTTGRIPLVFGRVEIPYLKKAGFEKLFDRQLTFQGASCEVQGRAETRSTYTDLTCHYLALSDERKEGLVRVGLAEKNGMVIPGLENNFENHSIQWYSQQEIPDHFSDTIEPVVSSGLHFARSMIRDQLEPFYQSMQRRLKRDTRNTREYYQALSREMEESLDRRQLNPEQQADRRAKIQELPREAERKIADLREKYKIEVTINLAAVRRLLVDVVSLQVRVSSRKLTRDVHLTWNPLTRALEPLACEQCGAGMHIVHPVPSRNSFRMICGVCLKRT